MPLLCFGSLGTAICQNIWQMAAARTIQAIGASTVYSVGAATIADLYRVEERGTIMGIYFGVNIFYYYCLQRLFRRLFNFQAILVGPAIAPLVGGLAATYYSWRLMQYILFGFSLVIWICVVILLPETAHPGTRGIDKLRAQDGSPAKWRFVWLNPFKVLTLLKSPNLLLTVRSMYSYI